jgi:S-adenosylmethionine hydrolase
MPKNPLISITTDFGAGTQGVGIMHGVAFDRCPEAVVIDLAHNVVEYCVIDGARQMETCLWLPIGIHVCVVDPGVGSSREVVAILTGRGDILIGPDNGVLRPASRRLGGIVRAHAVTNRSLWRAEVSTTFHGRDIMMPVAASLASGIPIEDVGPLVAVHDLHPPPYDDVVPTDIGCVVRAIHFNKYGTITINLMAPDFERWVEDCSELEVRAGAQYCLVRPCKTFSDVPPDEPIIFADDYGRVGLARNLASFLSCFPISIGQNIELIKRGGHAG